MTNTSTEQQIAAAWNAQADEFNQWDELGLDEKIEWAAQWGATQQRSFITNAPRRTTGDQPMTQHITTGGPAFPCVCTNDGDEETYGFNHDVIPAGTTCQYRGLTMRDWFAGKALQGLLASEVKASEEQFAEYSYKVADAMLRAREGV